MKILSLIQMSIALTLLSANAADLTLFPGNPVLAGSTVIGNQSTFAPGFQFGSWQAPGVGAKPEMYISPALLFPGKTVKVSDIASVSFWTNKAGTAADIDWFFALYTVKQVGDPNFYHSRLTSETAFTNTPFVAANTWHKWSTNDPTNPMHFYDSNRNGGIFGISPPNPTLADIQAGPITWTSPGGTTNDYRPEEVLFFSWQVGSCCNVGFTGLIDGLTVTLTDGTVGNINLEAIQLDGTFQVRYASNLNGGDGVVNIINPGTNGAPLAGPGFGSNVGNICVNAYAFSPDEQLIACCSCLVTPNGVVSVSVRNDLISNTLTGVRPDSVVIKLVNTAAGPGFTGTACSNSAALAGSAGFPLATGLNAFGTTVHSGSVAGSFATTETAFSNATLSPGELASITGRCTNIIGNGSSFGICNGCRVGGLMATAR